MKETYEWFAYVGVIAILSGLVYGEGKRNVELHAQVSLTGQELYRKIAHSKTKLQIIDVRADSSEYEDTHIPGAIPFPNCDMSATPDEAKQQIFSFVPTIIVSKDGDMETFKKCQQNFTVARNLAGGIAAWDDASLPEDSGEYVPPKASAGGGCL